MSSRDKLLTLAVAGISAVSRLAGGLAGLILGATTAEIMAYLIPALPARLDPVDSLRAE